jgi:hypothetical protein
MIYQITNCLKPESLFSVLMLLLFLHENVHKCARLRTEMIIPTVVFIFADFCQVLCFLFQIKKVKYTLFSVHYIHTLSMISEPIAGLPSLSFKRTRRFYLSTREREK